MGDEEWITKTQAELGAVITAPKLPAKLLGKPPFRFLHDVVTSFIKTNNFPVGYYSDDQMDSTKVTDKEAKLEFLAKLVTVVQVATGKTSTCKPAKTIAGQEPEGTNNLLQLLASCAAMSQDAKDAAVKSVIAGPEAEAAPPKTVAEPAKPKTDDKDKEREREKERAREKEKDRERRKEQERDEKRKSKDADDEEAAKERERRERKDREHAERKKRDEEKAAAAEDDAAGKKPSDPNDLEEEDDEHRSKDKRDKRDKHDKHSKEKRDKHDKRDKKDKDSSSGGTKLQPTAAIERPGTATARKPPPPVKNNEMREDRVENPKEVAAVIAEEKRGSRTSKKDGEDPQDWQKLVEEHDAARAHHHSNAEEALGYLGKEAIEARRRQEELKKAEAEAEGSSAQGLILHINKNKEKGGSAVGDSELTRLKEQLQLLTKATNPLGKFLEAIHEDIDTMSRELEMWRTEARTQAASAKDAQRQTEESLHEIYGKIQNVEDTIGDQLVCTNILRASIIQNDKTVEMMIRMVVSPDSGLASKGSKK